MLICGMKKWHIFRVVRLFVMLPMCFCEIGTRFLYFDMQCGFVF